MSEMSHLGTGLSNAIERLEMLYGKEGRLDIKENLPSGVKVILDVPYEEYPIRKTIQAFDEKLYPDLFFSIHKGTIVNARFIDKIYTLPGNRGRLRLKDRPEIHHISHSYSNRFKQM